MKPILRVLFFSTFFEFRGEPTNLAEEIINMTKNYDDIRYIVYSIGPLNEKDRVLKYSKNILWIQRTRIRNIKTLIRFIKEIIKIHIKFKPQIVHSTYVIESLIMGIFANIFRVPSILHGRGTDLNYEPFLSFKSNLLARIACKINKKVITVSKTMKRDVIKLNVPAKKITYIYDGLDFLKFTPKKIKDFSDKENFKIIHANRYSPEKCQDLIIEVCRELKENNINFRLTMIGYGPLENNLKDLIKKYHLENHVIMGGFIEHDKVPEYLENADLYIQPSLTEGMPKSVYEAMSMELPVIITNVGGMSELNVTPGVIKIETNNRKQLYDAIIHLMNNHEERKIGGKNNREYVLKNFNWDLHSQKLYKIYLELIKNNF